MPWKAVVEDAEGNRLTVYKDMLELDYVIGLATVELKADIKRIELFHITGNPKPFKVLDLKLPVEEVKRESDSACTI